MTRQVHQDMYNVNVAQSQHISIERIMGSNQGTQGAAMIHNPAAINKHLKTNSKYANMKQIMKSTNFATSGLQN